MGYFKATLSKNQLYSEDGNGKTNFVSLSGYIDEVIGGQEEILIDFDLDENFNKLLL